MHVLLCWQFLWAYNVMMRYDWIGNMLVATGICWLLMPRNQEIISKSDFIFSHAPNFMSHLLTTGSHASHYLFLAYFSKGLCNFICANFFMTKEALLAEDMGADIVRNKPNNPNYFKNDPLV